MYTTEPTITMTDRIARLKRSVREFKPGLCTERAVLWTRYFKRSKNRENPMCIRIAEALDEVLMKKTIRIYPDELIVGNFTSKRVGGQIQPELIGTAVMEDIFKFPRRKTSPLQISARETARLLGILPYWLPRFLGIRIYDSPAKNIYKFLKQMKSRFYVINETGGIAHTAPDYERLIRGGVQGVLSEATGRQQRFAERSDPWWFLESVKIVARAFARFGERYEKLARRMAEKEPDPGSRRDLEEIADACKNAIQNGAATFREALQIVYLAHIVTMIEGL
ncbi:MAG: formate acetyltransferase, partial [Desulfobacterales bacterium]|nr:formate acetyltransferase [Desulfobacterales bacterium]